MGFLGFTFYPREMKFFDMFDEAATTLRRAAGKFVDLLVSYDNLQQRSQELKEEETKLDGIIGGIIKALDQTFITPFDREDIHTLATSLDDILDNMEETAHRFAVFRIDKPTEVAVKLARIIFECCTHLEQAIRECRNLRKPEEIQSHLREIGRLENEADRLYRDSDRALFANGATDILMLIKLRELYSWLEETVDACKDASQVISEIVIKGSWIMFEFFRSAWDNLGTTPFANLTLIVWLLILLALTFDFLNGLHDAANSIATVVSTRMLSPRGAVIWAALFNFIAFLIFPLKVAATIANDVVDQSMVTDATIANYLIAATQLACCGWNIFTWYLGLPTSSSHALIGGMVGATIMLKGFAFLKLEGLFWIVLFIFLAPLIGLVLGLSISVIILWLCRAFLRDLRVNNFFRRGQLISAALFSLGHGGNDAQKTMGIILVLLIAASPPSAPVTEVPTEVVLSCHLAMGLGTLFGGWRIVKTMGQRIIRLRPVDGFGAETGAALTLALTTFFRGIPISTTHTITGAIVGVGSLKRLSAVRWGVAGQVVWAWILTIPGSALLAMVAVVLLRMVT